MKQKNRPTPSGLLRFIAILLCGVLLPCILQANPSLTVETEGTVEIITLAIGNTPAHKIFFLENPPRLVIDAPIGATQNIALPKHYTGSLIERVREGQFNPTTTRIVFDLKSTATLLTQNYDDDKLTISISSNKKPPRTKESAVSKPQKPLIIIDPGHGGDDPGAIGPRRSQEKDIVLTFAKALEQSLLATGKYRVLLTRDSDHFIMLRERVKIARQAKGSLFISLHADSAPNDEARGLSVYTLSEKASDAETEALAARENKVDILGDMDLSHEREDVADILISLASRQTRNQSALLADLLTSSLSKQVRLLPNPHRFAGFAVLKAPDIPSVLIETGFISHPAEEKLLKTHEYRTKLITGIVNGVNEYSKRQK